MVVSRNLLRLLSKLVDRQEIELVVSMTLHTIEQDNCSDIERILIFELLGVSMLPI